MNGNVPAVVEQVERALGQLEAARQLLEPAMRPTSSSRSAEAGRHVNAARSHLKSALIRAGRLPAGAALVDDRQPLVELGDVDDDTLRARRSALLHDRQLTHRLELDAIERELDRRQQARRETDAQREINPRPITAVFVGGPFDGELRALQELAAVLDVPAQVGVRGQAGVEVPVVGAVRYRRAGAVAEGGRFVWRYVFDEGRSS